MSSFCEDFRYYDVLMEKLTILKDCMYGYTRNFPMNIYAQNQTLHTEVESLVTELQ